MTLAVAAQFYNGWEAGLAQARLTAEGIDSEIFDLNMSGFEMSLVIPVRLMVLEKDLVRAQAVLDSPNGAEQQSL